MPRPVRVALTQTCNVFPGLPDSLEALDRFTDRLEDIRSANLAHHVALIRSAAEQGARIIGLGEMFAAPFFALSRHPMWHALAEDAFTGPTARTLSEAARANRLIIVAPIFERDAHTGLAFNTAIVIDEEGRVLGRYRKVHLPKGSNEKGGFDEPFYFTPSDGRLENDPAFNISSNPYFPVFRTSIGRVGVAICYDRHFEGVMYSLAREGAELIFSPAVTFGSKSARMWELEFAVDAARHNVFIAGSNRKGIEKPWNQPFFGNSHVVGPNGRLEDVSRHPELIVSDVNLEVLRQPDPAGWNLERDVRYETYSRRGD